MKAKLFFAWYDFWVGAYWDRENGFLYLCLIPTVVIKFSWLKIWYNGSDNIIAKSKEAAIKIWEQTCGENWEDYEEYGDEWIIENQKSYRLNFEDEAERDELSPKNAEKGHDDGGYYAKASNRAWIKHQGAGWLSSENY